MRRYICEKLFISVFCAHQYTSCNIINLKVVYRIYIISSIIFLYTFEHFLQRICFNSNNTSHTFKIGQNYFLKTVERMIRQTRQNGRRTKIIYFHSCCISIIVVLIDRSYLSLCEDQHGNRLF